MPLLTGMRETSIGLLPLLRVTDVNLYLYAVISVVNLYVMVNTEQTFFNANDAVWPALSSLTGILLR